VLWGVGTSDYICIIYLFIRELFQSPNIHGNYSSHQYFSFDGVEMQPKILHQISMSAAQLDERERSESRSSSRHLS